LYYWWKRGEEMVKQLYLLLYLLSVVALASTDEFEDQNACILQIKDRIEVGLLESSHCDGFVEARDAVCSISQCRDWLVKGVTWCSFWHKCEKRCKSILKDRLYDDPINILKIIVPDRNDKYRVVFDKGFCPSKSDDLDPCYVCVSDGTGTAAYRWEDFYRD